MTIRPHNIIKIFATVAKAASAGGYIHEGDVWSPSSCLILTSLTKIKLSGYKTSAAIETVFAYYTENSTMIIENCKLFLWTRWIHSWERSALLLYVLHMPQHIQHWGYSLECLSTRLVRLSYRLTWVWGLALTDERPARKGGRGGRSRTLPQGLTPQLTVICSTHLLHPVLWFDCDGKEEVKLGYRTVTMWKTWHWE